MISTQLYIPDLDAGSNPDLGLGCLVPLNQVPPTMILGERSGVWKDDG